MKNRRLIVIAILFSAALGAGIWFLSQPIIYQAKPLTYAASNADASPQPAIATKEQPTSPAKASQNPTMSKNLRQDDEAFDPLTVQSLLQEVKLDEHNNLVLDDNTKRLLDRAVLMLGQERSQLALHLIEQMIRSGLPGNAGEKAAAVFVNYYDYKKAEAEIAATAHATDLDGSRKALDQISQLRQSYLGHDVAQALFSEEEEYLRNMMALMEEAEAEIDD